MLFDRGQNAALTTTHVPVRIAKHLLYRIARVRQHWLRDFARRHYEPYTRLMTAKLCIAHDCLTTISQGAGGPANCVFKYQPAGQLLAIYLSLVRRDTPCEMLLHASSGRAGPCLASQVDQGFQ
jgi:hypothetical protein